MAVSRTPGTWDIARAREVAGSGVSATTCRRAIAYLEQLGALAQIEPDV